MSIFLCTLWILLEIIISKQKTEREKQIIKQTVYMLRLQLKLVIILILYLMRIVFTHAVNFSNGFYHRTGIVYSALVPHTLHRYQQYNKCFFLWFFMSLTYFLSIYFKCFWLCPAQVVTVVIVCCFVMVFWLRVQYFVNLFSFCGYLSSFVP